MAAKITAARFLLLSATITIALLLATPAADSPEFFSGERDALLSFLNSLNSPATLLSNWTGPPCFHNRSRWLGVLCSNSHVVALLLDSHDLVGSLPAAAFHNLPRLTNLSLSNNSLHGNIPSLRRLTHLQETLLSRNRFSGKISDEFLSLHELSRLELQENRLNGTIPPFQQKRLVAFNVSGNFLEGGIPRTPVLERFGSTSFDSNTGLCGGPLRKRCPPPAAALTAPIPESRIRVPVWLIVLISIASLLIFIAVVLYFFRIDVWIHYHQVPTAEERGARFFLDIRDSRHYDAEDFRRFPAARIGEGRGRTYRIVLPSGRAVAAKVLREVELSADEFYGRVNQLFGLWHENVGPVIGCYSGEIRNIKMVIYEHVDGRSLFQLLHERVEGDVELNCRRRLEIAHGIAQGMYYLHLFVGGAIGDVIGGESAPHGNLKSSNVIISSNSMIPKLVNYGFIPLLPPSQVQLLAVGLTPELNRPIEPATVPVPNTDVYCFGLLLIELVRGIKATRQNVVQLVQSVHSLFGHPAGDWKGRTLDPNIAGDTEGHRVMLDLLEAAAECTALLPEERPEMLSMMQRVENLYFSGLI